MSTGTSPLGRYADLVTSLVCLAVVIVGLGIHVARVIGIAADGVETTVVDTVFTGVVGAVLISAGRGSAAGQVGSA